MATINGTNSADTLYGTSGAELDLWISTATIR